MIIRVWFIQSYAWMQLMFFIINKWSTRNLRWWYFMIEEIMGSGGNINEWPGNNLPLEYWFCRDMIFGSNGVPNTFHWKVKSIAQSHDLSKITLRPFKSLSVDNLVIKNNTLEIRFISRAVNSKFDQIANKTNYIGC